MHHGSLLEILILLAAAVFIVTIFKLLRLSPVLGYLAAGGAIGPYGLAIIGDIESTTYIAEFGVVFLLFSIGLELTIERLKSMRLHVFGFGSAQMIICGTLIGSFCYLFGIDPASSIIIGGGLALSSTAIVLQILAERKEQSTQIGRLSLSALILQDLAVAPLLIMVTLLAQENANLSEVIIDALVKAVITLFIIFIIGLRLLRPLFALIAASKSQELFIATILLIVLGSSYVTEWAGLSLALGAFAAGLLIAETEYRPQVEADIAPFKGLLMGLFFMTVGMKLDYMILSTELWKIIFLTTLLLASKFVVVMILSRLFGFRRGCSIQAGVLLAQGGEFAFVLFDLAAGAQVLDKEISQLLLVIITLSMAVTPLMVTFGKKISRRFELTNPVHLESSEISKETLDLDGHIIVAGFSQLGRNVCKLLQSEKIKFVALDDNPTNVHHGRKIATPVFYGTTTRTDILKSLGIERAKMIVITLKSKEETDQAVKSISRTFPTIPIIARALDREHADHLRNLGATVCMAEKFETSIHLGSTILDYSGFTTNEIYRIIENFRQNEYPISSTENILHHSPMNTD